MIEPSMDEGFHYLLSLNICDDLLRYDVVVYLLP